MASKGQKFKKYSLEFKDKILKEYFEGFASSRFLSEKYNISRKTIETWVRKTKLKIDVRVDHRPGNSGKTKSNPLSKKKVVSIADIKNSPLILMKEDCLQSTLIQDWILQE